MNQHKKRHHRGFTLTETLVALLILSMLTGAIAIGISTAVKAKSSLLFTSESDLLASTLNIALGDVLHYALEPSEANGVVSFTNYNYGVTKGHFLNTGDKLYLNTADVEDGAENVELLTLVSDGAYTSLKIQEFSIAYQNGVFSGTYTIFNGDKTLQKAVPFTFRPLN